MLSYTNEAIEKLISNSSLIQEEIDYFVSLVGISENDKDGFVKGLHYMQNTVVKKLKEELEISMQRLEVVNERQQTQYKYNSRRVY
jgi:hypothetical protein